MCSRKIFARRLSPVGTACFGRHAAPPELEKEFGASVLHIYRSYGTFRSADACLTFIPVVLNKMGEILRISPIANATLQAQRAAQAVHFIEFFPGKIRIIPAEMPIRGGFLVNRAAQIERGNNALRR